MSARLASIVLAASAVVSAYIVLLIGYVLPSLFARVFRVEAPSDLAILMPPITQFAARFASLFALATASACVVIVTLLRRSPARVLQLLSIGMSAQVLRVGVLEAVEGEDGFLVGGDEA